MARNWAPDPDGTERYRQGWANAKVGRPTRSTLPSRHVLPAPRPPLGRPRRRQPGTRGSPRRRPPVARRPRRAGARRAAVPLLRRARGQDTARGARAGAAARRAARHAGLARARRPEPLSRRGGRRGRARGRRARHGAPAAAGRARPRGAGPHRRGLGAAGPCPRGRGPARRRDGRERGAARRRVARALALAGASRCPTPRRGWRRSSRWRRQAPTCSTRRSTGRGWSRPPTGSCSSARRRRGWGTSCAPRRWTRSPTRSPTRPV